MSIVRKIMKPLIMDGSLGSRSTCFCQGSASSSPRATMERCWPRDMLSTNEVRIKVRGVFSEVAPKSRGTSSSRKLRSCNSLFSINLLVTITSSLFNGLFIIDVSLFMSCAPAKAIYFEASSLLLSQTLHEASRDIRYLFSRKRWHRISHTIHRVHCTTRC